MRGLIAATLAIVGHFDSCHAFARFNDFLPNGKPIRFGHATLKEPP
jgi:hypothetical protein